MKLLRQMLIILLICCVGEIIHKLFNLYIPGNVIGMVILFICLCTGIIKLEMISEISKFLIDHLAFFFIPAGVGLVAYFDLFRENWAAILSISFIVTIVVMIISGHTVQVLRKGSKK
ncbi:MAG TPA: CidA/LrgA family protein [Clostridiaceae bacterium]|nr:CidA/LrgA family protein [Clostridiaceae bacterium]